jgi:hypothetical protein
MVDNEEDKPNDIKQACPYLAYFHCPITLDLMVDPVVASDGFTYERAAIEKWIKIKGTSPFTRAPLRSEMLRVPRLCLDTSPTATTPTSTTTVPRVLGDDTVSDK